MKLLLSAITALILAFSIGTSSQGKPKAEVKTKEDTNIQSSMRVTQPEKQKQMKDNEKADVTTNSSVHANVVTESSSSSSQDKDDDILDLLPKIKTHQSNNLNLSGNVTVEQELE